MEKHAEFVRWMGPLLDALRSLGGKARPRECSQLIAKNLSLSPSLTEAKLHSGGSRFHNQVQWARQYLVWEGLIDSSERGVWILTPKGADAQIDETQGRKIFLKWVEIHQRERETKQPETGKVARLEVEDKEPAEPEEQTLLGVLRTLPPEGFERICKRLLHEFNFEDVEVVGKSRDGGIDGVGTLRLNPFVSIKIVFQCKRYEGAVARAQIGDFRNSMWGRAEKGIFITTGYFSADAEKEACRDGVPPIELVDGEQLVQLFEAKQLGLKPKQSFEIDQTFFDQFR